MTNRFYTGLIFICALLGLLFVALFSEAQVSRRLWHGNANVGGDWDVYGGNGSTAQKFSATTTIKAATMILGASEVEINIPVLSASMDGYGLLFNSTVNDIALREIILAALDDITNVTTSTKAEGDVLYWNASDSVWSATPQSSGSGGATTLDGLTDTALIAPASGEYLQHNGTAWFNHPFNQALTDVNDVVIAAPSDNDVLTYDSATGQWSAEAGGGGSTTLDGLTDTALISPASGEYLQHNGVAWYNHIFNQALTDINNVDITAPSDNDVLTYDSATGKWTEAAGGAGSGDNPYSIVAQSDSPYAAIADYVCDGTADNVQIQTAIDELNGGGRVMVLEGTYNMAAIVLCTTDSVTLSGEGQGTRFIRKYNETGGTIGFLYMMGDANVLRDFYVYGGAATYTDTDNVGVTIGGNYSSIYNVNVENTKGAGLEFASDYGLASNCHFSDCSTTLGAITLIACDYSLIINCSFYNGPNYGAYIEAGANYCSFIHCSAVSNADDGFYITSGNYVNVIDCFSYDNTSGGIFQNADYGIVSNCVSDSDSGFGIKASGVHNMITHNQIIDTLAGYGIQIDTSAADASISGNTIYNVAYDGIYAGNAGHRAFISDNEITTTGDNGIEINNSTDAHITANMISGAADYGISIGNYNEGVDRALIVANLFLDNGNASTDADIFLMATDDTIVKDNVFYSDTPDYAIILDDDVGDPCDRLILNGNIYKGSYTETIHENTGHDNLPSRVLEHQMLGSQLILSSSDVATVAGFAIEGVTTTISSAAYQFETKNSYQNISLAADYVFSSTPIILKAQHDGQILYLHNLSDFVAEFPSIDTRSGSGIEAGGGSTSLQPHSTITFFFNGAENNWLIQSHPNTSTDPSALLLDVRNSSGDSIAAGQLVYMAGYNTGLNRIEIELADYDAGFTPAIGITFAAIANGGRGQIIWGGLLADQVDTSAFSTNDALYLSNTPGALTDTPPSAGMAPFARVVYSSATVGKIIVVGAGLD